MNTGKIQMTEEMMPVCESDPMPFFCGSANACFTACCRDLNQALTPYDILRLKNSLGIDSGTFLRRYTSRHFGPDSGLPVVSFTPDPATGYACPFVNQAGCSVYQDRPGSCRMYPLARAISRSRETGVIREYFALIVEDHCRGFGKKTGQIVRHWLESQDVELHNHYNDQLMELISLKNRMMPGTLGGDHADLFYTALYDLDTFKTQIFEQDLLKPIVLPGQVKDNIRAEDEALFKLGIQWVKYQIFGVEMTWS